MTEERTVFHIPSSYPAKAGYPVRRGLSVQSLLPLDTGSLAGACHRARIRATRWRMMTTEYVFAISRRDAPEFCKSTRPKREGAGKTGCALHPRSRAQDAQAKTHTSIQVQRRASGLPCAMVLRLIARSPR